MWNSHKCFIYVWQQFFSVSLLRPIFSISSSRSGLGDTITRSFVVLCLSRLHARFLHKHRNEQKYGDFENAKDVLRRTAYLLLHDFFVEICLLEWWVGFYVFMVIVGNGWELLFPINIIYLCFFYVSSQYMYVKQIYRVEIIKGIKLFRLIKRNMCQ